MKTLALSIYGVQEMDEVEMREASGGNSIAREGLKWLWRVIRDGAAYEVVKSAVESAAQHYQYDSEVNYTPWYGPNGGGFK